MAQKYAQFNQDGLPSAFYDSDIHGKKIPKDAMKITNEQWQDFVNNQGLRVWDGEKVVEYTEPQEVTDERNRLNRIAELKQLLRESDYVTLSDYDKEKPDVIAQRAEWRAEVRTLEND